MIVDGTRIISTGYIKSPEKGFLFWADEASPAVWELDTSGSLVTEKLLSQSYLPQGAKIRYEVVFSVLEICAKTQSTIFNQER